MQMLFLKQDSNENKEPTSPNEPKATIKTTNQENDFDHINMLSTVFFVHVPCLSTDGSCGLLDVENVNILVTTAN